MENYKVKTSLSPKQKSTQLSSTQCNHLAQFHSSTVPNNEAKENLKFIKNKNKNKNTHTNTETQILSLKATKTISTRKFSKTFSAAKQRIRK